MDDRNYTQTCFSRTYNKLNRSCQMFPYHRRMKLMDVYQGSNLRFKERLLNMSRHKSCLAWYFSIPVQPKPFDHIWSPSGLKCYINTRLVYRVRMPYWDSPGFVLRKPCRGSRRQPHSPGQHPLKGQSSLLPSAAGAGTAHNCVHPFHLPSLMSNTPEVQLFGRKLWVQTAAGAQFWT